MCEQAQLQAFDERRSSGIPATRDELRALLGPLDDGEEDSLGSVSDGTDITARVRFCLFLPVSVPLAVFARFSIIRCMNQSVMLRMEREEEL